MSQNTKKLTEKNQHFLLLAVLGMLSWGGSWASAKVVSSMASAEVLVFWRFFLTFLSFIPIMFIFKQSFKINLKAFAFIFFAGVFLSLYTHIFFLGLQKGLASIGGVLTTSLNPVFTFLLSVLFFKQKSLKKDWLGVGLGFLGGLIMIEIWNFSYENLLASGNLLFLIASLLWAFVTFSTHKGTKICSPFAFSFYLYGVTSVCNVFFVLNQGVMQVFSLSSLFWYNLFFLAFFSTTFGTTIYFFATKKLGSNRASSLIFLVPPAALFFSLVFLKEKPGIYTIIGGSLATFAVYLINKKPLKKAKI